MYDISVIYKETGQVINSSDTQWCRVTEISPNEWTYGFEEMKGLPNADMDYSDPLLLVKRVNNRIKVTILKYNGIFHADIIVLKRTVWRGVCSTKYVGASAVVELPEILPLPPIPPEVPTPPPPPAPVQPTIDLTPVVQKLDTVISKIDGIGTIPKDSNDYSVVNIDLSVARDNVQYQIGGKTLTVYSNTGEFSIRLGDTAVDSIPVYPLVYPVMLSFQKFDFNKFFITNTAQPGRSAILIVWRRS